MKLKKVLITGATKGLGLALSKVYLDNNYLVGVNYHKDDRAFDLLRDEYGRKNILKLKYDIADNKEVNAMVDCVKSEWGNLDVLINNAGFGSSNMLSNISEDEFNMVFNTNLAGPMQLSRLGLDMMKDQKSGHIINIASILGIQGQKGASVYSMTKACLISFSKEFAREAGEFNVRVNVVLPGFMLTEMTQSVSQEIVQKKINENVLKRVSDPGVVAREIYLINSMENVSGQVFNLDGRVI
ncbi:SDR family oxidoreductase [bacterium]|nr:SDR family oxidoreductase [bacterium]